MRAEDIRRLYRESGSATEEEYRQTRERARTDPDEARRLFEVLLALGHDDATFARLLRGVIDTLVVDLVAERLATDDAYALRVGDVVLKLMDALGPGAKVPRGKNARTA